MKKLLATLVILVSLLSACQQNMTVQGGDVSSLTPEQVVRLYYESWNNKQYDIIYSLISDGFKQIDPTANTFEKFKSSMEELFNVASGVRVFDVKEVSRDDKGAVVDFKIQIIGKDGSKQEIGKTFTLKKRANGWNLIHPYGNNIDTT